MTKLQPQRMRATMLMFMIVINLVILQFLGLASKCSFFLSDMISLKEKTTKNREQINGNLRSINSARSPHSIGMNHDSTYVRSDISKILHIPEESRIEIHLQADRRCQNPVFKGRISGWSLSMIDFEDDVVENKIVGTYDVFHMPVSGRYPVEILLLLCEKYPSDFLSMNLLNVCLETEGDDTSHITSRDEHASITVDLLDHPKVELTSQAEPNSRRGRWVHKSLSNKSSKSGKPIPVLTPFQPKGCNAHNVENEHCRPTTLGRQELFEEYEYQWGSRDAELNELGFGKLLDQLQPNDAYNSSSGTIPLKTVCFVGASHSLHLRGEVIHLQKEVVPADTSFRSFHFQRCFPEEITNDHLALNAKLNMCTHVVLGVFQWHFSNYPRHEEIKPWEHLNFTWWQNEMTEAVRKIQEVKSIEKIFLRSTHSNGLGADHTACPPHDNRTPINSAIANQLLREVVNGFSDDQVKFLDTSFLMDPVWDAAKDWSHYEGGVREAETKLIISEVFKDAKR